MRVRGTLLKSLEVDESVMHMHLIGLNPLHRTAAVVYFISKYQNLGGKRVVGSCQPGAVCHFQTHLHHPKRACFVGDVMAGCHSALVLHF